MDAMKPGHRTISFLHIDANPGYAAMVRGEVFKCSNGAVTSITTSSLEKALKIFTVIVFDAVVVDLDLPDCSGTEIIRKFRTRHPDLPVIVLTDVEDEPTVVKSIMGGVQGYFLKKDFSGLMLADLVRRAVEIGELSGRYGELPGLLHRHEKCLGTIVSNIDIGIVAVNKKNLIVFANPCAERLLSTDAHRLAGSEFSFPLKTGTTLEIDLKRNDAIKQTVEMRVSEVPWDREPVYLVVLNDVTVKKEVEAGNELLAEIQAENPNPFLRIDEKNMIVYANDAGATLMTRWGCGFFSAVPPFLAEPIQTCARNRSKRVLEVPCGRRTYLFAIVPVRRKGQINLYGTDITQLKRTETALRESRDRYQALVKAGGNGISKMHQPGPVSGAAVQAG
ncbi:MAG: response regulator [Chitinispirillaceae bacterium]|nr:response regulator [Chitinispirillaceae bacterium]